MPQQAWGKKTERRYEHIKDSQQDQGASAERAKEIAARTVNKNHAQSGNADQRSRTAVTDKSPQQRGGERSGRGLGPGGPTKDQLHDDAQRRNIKGRSTMTKSELEQALNYR